MKIEYIFDEFKDLYPSMVESVTNVFQHGPYGIIVKLYDGKVFEFYILDKTSLFSTEGFLFFFANNYSEGGKIREKT